MRTIPATTLKNMFALESEEHPVVLISCERSGEATLYLSSDPTERLIEDDQNIWYGTMSRGQPYLYFPFQLTLANDQEESIPGMKIVIDNVDGSIGWWFRSSINAADVTVEIVSSGDLDTVIASFPDFELKSFTGDTFQVNGMIQLNTYSNESYPSGRFTPADFPGLF